MNTSANTLLPLSTILAPLLKMKSQTLSTFWNSSLQLIKSFNSGSTYSERWYESVDSTIIYVLKWSYDLRSYGRNFCNCVEKSEKFRTSTGFEPVTSRFRCDALTNWAMKPLTLGAVHLWVLMVPWGMNQWWNGIYEMNHIWTADMKSSEAMIFAVMSAIFAIA